jgi:hypothetical protein
MKRLARFTEEEARELDDAWREMEVRARTIIEDLTRTGLDLTTIGSACAAALVLAAKLEDRTYESVIGLIRGLWDAFKLADREVLH